MLSFYQPVDDKELETLCQEFESLTGYSLLYKGKPYADNHDKQATERIPVNQNDIYPENQSEPVEQNLAFSCFDAEFEGERILPCKKGIQSDAQGKYLQIAFLSPQLGVKMKDTLQRIADQTGWRIRIADSVNQNMVLAYANQICKEKSGTFRI